MISYGIDKQNYAELYGLSTDTKPTGKGAVPNGAKFTEIETAATYRFNGENGEWIKQGVKYPVKLEVSSGKYKATYSDTTTDADVTAIVEGDYAYFTDNGVTVKCDAITVNVAVAGDTETAVYDGEEHTATGYTATADNDGYTPDTDLRFGGVDEVSRTEVGKSMMGLKESDFENTNTYFKVVVTVTDGYVEITEAESNDNEEDTEQQ